MHQNRFLEHRLVVLVGGWGLRGPGHSALPMHTLAAGVFAAYSSMMDFDLGPFRIGGGGSSSSLGQSPAVLLHHPECMAEFLSEGNRFNKEACSAAVSMFQAVSMHPVERTVAYLGHSKHRSCNFGVCDGRWIGKLLVGLPHSSYGSVR